jgi:hypothetical protein
VAAGLLLVHVSVRGIFLVSAIPALVAVCAISIFGPWGKKSNASQRVAVLQDTDPY